VTVLVLSWMITLYTLWQMVQMHEIVEGKRFDRYHELGQEAFGERLGLWIVVPQQLIVEVGVDIVYMVTGGKSLQHFYSIVCKGSCPMRPHTTAWIAIFSSVHFALSQLPNFNSIAGVSLAAACMSLRYAQTLPLNQLLTPHSHSPNSVCLWLCSYSTIAWCIPAAHGHSHPPLLAGQYADYKLPDQSMVDHVFYFFNALGTVAFAYAGHNVVLEIQATIPSTKERPSKVPMWKGVMFAYMVVAICYFPVAIIGYWAYGNNLQNPNDNVLIYVASPKWLIAVANLMVVVHVIGSYQIYAMPVFDMLESVLVLRLHLKPSRLLRIVTRSTYVGKPFLTFTPSSYLLSPPSRISSTRWKSLT
jgi:hypothetical protein